MIAWGKSLDFINKLVLVMAGWQQVGDMEIRNQVYWWSKLLSDDTIPERNRLRPSVVVATQKENKDNS